MFKVKILAVMLTAAIAIGGSLSPSAAKAFSKKQFNAKDWWMYNGTGLVTDPASYYYLGSDPGCAGSEQVCAIQVETSYVSGYHIVPASFQSLKIESEYFQYPGYYLHGTVEFLSF